MEKNIGVMAIACVMVAVLFAGCIGSGISIDDKESLYTIGDFNDGVLNGDILDGDGVWVRGNLTENALVIGESGLWEIELDDLLSAQFDVPTTIPTDVNTSGYRLNALQDIELGEEIALFIEVDTDGARGRGITTETLTLTVIQASTHFALDWLTVDAWEATVGAE